jgi:signal transduction histidine kinase/CheY-like chemotaxis protein
MLANLSIRTRLLILSSFLIATIMGSTYFLTSKLSDSSQAVTKNAELAQLIDIAQRVRSDFGEYRYWLTDLAVSLLRQSELNAKAVRERLTTSLDALESQRPETARILRHEIADFERDANQAVDQYTDDQRVIGNTSLARARQHSLAINERLKALVDDLNTEVTRSREQVLTEISRTTELAYIIVAVTILGGIAITILVLRSILVPLHQVVSAMEGITAGNLQTPVPKGFGGEIGTMAKTLLLFRESIAERERLAQEAKKQHQMFATAIETISDGFVLYDAKDHLVVCNAKFREIYPKIDDVLVPGAEFRNILRAIVERGLVDLGGRSAEQWLAERTEAHRNPRGFLEYRYNNVWVRISERRTLDGGTVGVFTDISELKQRQSELEQAMLDADSANRAKSAFLANMSHELRTPLNAIIGYSEMLQELAQEDGLDEFSTDLNKIQDAGRHLLSLISDILDLSKIEAGKLELFIEDVGVPELVAEIRAIIEPIAAKNANELQVLLPPELGIVQTDRTKLKQGILNLLSNACKFTSKGTVSLEVAREIENGEDKISFIVRDTGIGMTQEQIGKLFQAFSQADLSTTKRFGGTGLGLAITKRFCEMLGGTVTVSSEPEKGSIFTIALPIQTTKQRHLDRLAATSLKEVVPEPGDSPLIMVVDDDEAARRILALLLRKEGMRVIEASSGETALELARTLHPDAITLDIMMPHMDGWSVLTALKSDPELAPIPVIVVTITTDRGVALSLGAADFMPKPIDRTRLLSVLNTLMNGARTVLLVEDDPPTRELTQRQLQKLGVEVIATCNGREAIAWLSTNPPPGLILLDLLMPEMDGFSVLDEIENRSEWKGVPLVILTGKVLTVEEKAMLQGRVRHILEKGSASADHLVSVVRQTLREQAGPRATSNGAVALGHG